MFDDANDNTDAKTLHFKHSGHVAAEKKLARIEEFCRQHAHPGCEPGKHWALNRVLEIIEDKS